MAHDEDFTAYVAGSWARLVRTAVLLGCTTHDAEDLVQTTLTRCYSSWSRVRDTSNRDAYVCRMLVNCHTDSRRRRWWGERPTERLPEVAEADLAEARVDQTDSVERALGMLPRPQREVLVLRYYAHLSEQETADALGLPVGTVKSRGSRALAALATSPHLTTNEGLET